MRFDDRAGNGEAEAEAGFAGGGEGREAFFGRPAEAGAIVGDGDRYHVALARAADHDFGVGPPVGRLAGIAEQVD